MALSWLSNLSRRPKSPCRGGRPHEGRRRCRPRLEALEDRRLPATVTTLLDNVPGSLREAIALTEPGGTVDFAPGLSGTITLTAGQLTIAKDLTIAGPGAGVLTVSGNNASRVFEVTSAVTVALSGLTIAFGLGDGLHGGGILNAGTLAVTASTLSSNSVFGAAGGGIYNSGGTLTITASTLSGNSAGFRGFGSAGGGIYNSGGTLT